MAKTPTDNLLSLLNKQDKSIQDTRGMQYVPLVSIPVSESTAQDSQGYSPYVPSGVNAAVGSPSVSPNHTHVNPSVVKIMPFASTLVCDAATSNYFRVTLTGAMTLANPIGATDGQKIILEFIQGGSGSYALTLGSKFDFGSDITTATLSTAVGAHDFMGAIYNATSDKFYIVAYVKGY